jgi:hypothetical protein
MSELYSAIGNLGTMFGSIGTAIGVFYAWRQIKLMHRQGVTTFEDSIAREYRDLAAKLNPKALLGESLTEEEYQNNFDEFYHYIDLCNEQAFLHQQNRISSETWKFWEDGIKSNLQRPAFRRAWNEIAKKVPSEFSELRRLIPPAPVKD